jgi:hypothetical protein
VIAVAIAGVLALVATVFVGPQAWLDFVTVVARTNRPVLTPHSVGLARVVYEAGLPESAAWTAYVANIVAVGAVFLVSLRRSTEVASFMVGAVASQMVSPVVWAHYAVVLFLPVAWLLSRERWWALLLLVPLSVPIAGMLPPVVYPIVFWVALAATAWEGRRGNVERLREQATPGSDAILAS